MMNALSKCAGILAFVTAIAAGAPVAAEARAATACQTITRQQVLALFDRWNRALESRKPAEVVATYAPDATLLPTSQNGPLTTPEAIGGYFTHFLELAPEAKVETRVIRTGCNVAYDIGLYTFTVNGDQPGSRKQVKARYTLIYAPVHGKWLIEHHHSSAFPVASP
jgi:uncharacterized protein (TIGR02246 family)